MTIFVQSILCLYCCLVVYSFIDSFNIEQEEQSARKEKDIWQHPLLVEAGIKKPLEEVELEEVSSEELPLCWSVKYNQRKDKHATILLIEEKSIS